MFRFRGHSAKDKLVLLSDFPLERIYSALKGGHPDPELSLYAVEARVAEILRRTPGEKLHGTINALLTGAFPGLDYSDKDRTDILSDASKAVEYGYEAVYTNKTVEPKGVMLTLEENPIYNMLLPYQTAYHSPAALS